jgi:dTDP-4-amino-4,6-dideoxygalactose transaminase
MSYFKPISISLSPNVEKDDLKIALNLIIRPWLWRRGKAVRELEEEFKKYLSGVNPVRNSSPASEISNGVKYAFSFNSGRSAFYAILRALELPEGEKVLLQAFTCNAAINPVLWAKLRPIYVDCDKDTFNIDIADLTLRLASFAQGERPKILMVQHTFGSPINMDEVNLIVRQYGLILVEDCAHALGAEFNNQKVGTFGKASFFSFSRDKIISSVYGGIAVTNDDAVGKKLEELQKEFGQPSGFWIFQQILHPILLHFIILPIYNFLDLGKIFLVLSQWLHILSKAVHWKEKRGQRPDYFPKALPNALAIMVLNQFKKLDKFYNHRKKLFEYYSENLKDTSFVLPASDLKCKPSYLRFTVKHPKAHEIIYEAWHKQNILLGDWYTTPIAPFDTKLDQMQYRMGMCPTAEKLSETTLNLPTHINISAKDAERIVNFLKKYK